MNTISQITLHLDAQQKRTIEDLFLTSAQVPALGLTNPTLLEDAAAIFRVAKEFTTGLRFDEQKLVATEDAVRMLRFICWLLGYEGGPRNAGAEGRASHLRQFFASVVLQGQSQFSGFEALLHSFGVDRQLEHQLGAWRKFERPASNGARLNLSQTNRTNQVQIRVSSQGAELVSTTTESTWKADARKS